MTIGGVKNKENLSVFIVAKLVLAHNKPTTSKEDVRASEV